MEKRTTYDGTQQERIRKYLESNPYITGPTAKEVLGVANLRARVDEMRKKGIKIVTTPTGPTSPSRYSLEQEKAVGKEVETVSDMKAAFVQAIEQVLTDKGLLLAPRELAPKPISEVRKPQAAILADATEKTQSSADPVSDAKRIEATIQRMTNALNSQITSVGRLNDVIDQASKNILNFYDSYRKKDSDRASYLLATTKRVVDELESRIAGSQLSGIDSISTKDKKRPTGLANLELNLKNANITIGKGAKLLLTQPLVKTNARMSGIDPVDYKEKDNTGGSGSGGSGGSGLGILGSLLGLGVGGAAIWTLLDKDLRNGVVEKVGGMLVEASKGAVNFLGDRIGQLWKDNPNLATMGGAAVAKAGLSGTAKVASIAAKGMAGAAKVLPDAVGGKVMGGAMNMAQAGRYAKLGSFVATPAAGLIDFGLRMHEGQGLKHSAGGAMASTAGMIVGGTLGSVLGPVGTFGGSVAGGWLGGKLYDGFAEPKKERGSGSSGMDNLKQKDNTGLPYMSMFGGLTNEPAKMTANNFDGEPKTPAEIERYFYNRLADPSTGFDLTAEQIAGALGNFRQETGNFTDFYNEKEGSSGVAQWHLGRRDKFRDMYGVMPHEAPYRLQGDYLIDELKGDYKHVIKALKEAKTAEEAAVTFERLYEKSDIKSAAGKKGLQNRIDFAKKSLENIRQYDRMPAVDVKERVDTFQKPKEPIIPQSSGVLDKVKEIGRGMAHTLQNYGTNTPFVPVPVPSGQPAPQPKSDSAPTVLTVRDNNNPLVRNVDKHTGFGFFK